MVLEAHALSYLHKPLQLFSTLLVMDYDMPVAHSHRTAKVCYKKLSESEWCLMVLAFSCVLKCIKRMCWMLYAVSSHKTRSDIASAI